MKKFLLAILAVIGTWVATYAVPSGTYRDNRGNTVVVTDSQKLYKVDSQGYIKERYQICDEKSDGSFSLLILDDSDNVINGLYPITLGIGWYQENGDIYLIFGSKTYTRQ